MLLRWQLTPFSDYRRRYAIIDADTTIDYAFRCCHYAAAGAIDAAAYADAAAMLPCRYAALRRCRHMPLSAMLLYFRCC